MTTTSTKPTAPRFSYSFATSREAWAFMRACEAAGVVAGFPTLVAPYTVETLAPAPAA